MRTPDAVLTALGVVAAVVVILARLRHRRRDGWTFVLKVERHRDDEGQTPPR